MARHGDFRENDKLLIRSEKLGFIRAWAGEDSTEFDSTSYMKVDINSKKFPGIVSLVIDTNEFDVWQITDPEAITHLVSEYLPLERTR